MAPIVIETDVPESRQVMVTLPPDVPPGRIRLTVVVEPAPERSGATPRMQAILPKQEPEVVFSGVFRMLGAERSA
jgi:hypothetical protein